MRRFAFVVAFVCLCVLCAYASPSYADVTITGTTKGPMGDSQVTMYIRGTKMRAETTLTGHAMTTLFDANARQMIVLDPETKQATTYDLAKMAEQMRQGSTPDDTKVSLTPTGQTKEIIGRRCTEFMLTMTTIARMGPNAMTVTISGPAWLAKEAPGTKDFATFFKAAADSGLFFNPAGGGAREGQSQAVMYKAFADAGGIPYEQEIRVKMEGMPMEPPAVKWVVTAVSTDPIPDEKFQVPAGYLKK